MRRVSPSPPPVDGSEGSGGKLRKWMKKAVKANAAAAVFVGADELAANAVTLKLLDTGDQRTVALPQLADALHHPLSTYISKH